MVAVAVVLWKQLVDLPSLNGSGKPVSWLRRRRATVDVGVGGVDMVLRGGFGVSNRRLTQLLFRRGRSAGGRQSENVKKEREKKKATRVSQLVCA